MPFIPIQATSAEVQVVSAEVPEGRSESSRGRKPPDIALRRVKPRRGGGTFATHLPPPLRGWFGMGPCSGGLRPRLLSGKARPPTNHHYSPLPPRPSGLLSEAPR